MTASSDHTARLWNVATGQEIAVLRGHTASVNSAAFNPGGTLIVSASTDGTAHLWEATSGRHVSVLLGHSAHLSGASFSSDGARIVTASADKTARVWDVATAREIATLAGHDGPVYQAAFSPDRTRIVTASDDNTARLWDGLTGQEIARLAGHSDTVLRASFSPDGARVVTASWDNTARVWDAATGNDIMVLVGHDGRVNSASFSPDGMRIATASLDTTARIWEAANGRQIASLRGHGDLLWSALFSPDGRQILTTSEDSTALLWDVSRTEAIARAPAISLVAALACGIGERTASEAGDLLMQEAPSDLYAEARRQLLDPEQHSPSEIAALERQLDTTIAALNAPQHPNCYLTPAAFAKKFGLEKPSTAARPPAVETGTIPAWIPENMVVTERDLVGAQHRENHRGTDIFSLADGRFYIDGAIALASLDHVRAAIDILADRRERVTPAGSRRGAMKVLTGGRLFCCCTSPITRPRSRRSKPLFWWTALAGDAGRSDDLWLCVLFPPATIARDARSRRLSMPDLD